MCVCVCVCRRARACMQLSLWHTHGHVQTHTLTPHAQNGGLRISFHRYSEPSAAHTCTKHAHMDARTTRPLPDVYKNADSHQSLLPFPFPRPRAWVKEKMKQAAKALRAKSSSLPCRRRGGGRGGGLGAWSSHTALCYFWRVWLCLWP